MFSLNRDQVRQFFSETWRKQRGGEMLTPLESIAADWISAHPEYHQALASPEAAAQDYRPEYGQANPFLHLSLHLAISEQLSIDQPRGIRAMCESLAARLGSAHQAQHVIMECLGETLWEAQRDQTPFDSNTYLERIKQQAMND